MFRSKPVLWGSMIGGLIIINLLVSFFSWIGRDITKYYLNISNNFTDNLYIDGLVDYAYSGVNEDFEFIQQMGDSSDVQIGYDLKERDGYVTYKDFMFTPMVGYAVDDVTDTSFGFSVHDSIVEVDLRKILDGLLEGKSWQDIGIDKEIFEGPIQVCIPSEHSGYYNSIYALFMQTYGYIKEANGEYSEEAIKKIDSVIAKCTKSNNIYSDIQNSLENDLYKKIFYIAPESYALMKDSEIYDSNNRDYYIPIYFNVSVAKSLDLQIRKDEEDKIEKSILKAATETKGFVLNTGWRVDKSNLSMGDITSKYSIRDFVNASYY